jgi:hypothetical protein
MDLFYDIINQIFRNVENPIRIILLKETLHQKDLH